MTKIKKSRLALWLTMVAFSFIAYSIFRHGKIEEVNKKTEVLRTYLPMMHQDFDSLQVDSVRYVRGSFYITSKSGKKRIDALRSLDYKNKNYGDLIKRGSVLFKKSNNDTLSIISPSNDTTILVIDRLN